MKYRWLFISVVPVILAALLWQGRGLIREEWQNRQIAAVRSALPTPTPHTTSSEVASPSVKTNPTSAAPPSPVPARGTKNSKTDPWIWNGPLPQSVNLDVPFLSQAPQQNWDLPYQEACEEASSIMIDAFYRGRTTDFAPGEGSEAILKLVAFEKNLLGKYEDTSAMETAKFIKEYFGYPRVVVHTNPTVDEIKGALANGYPVLVPAYGKGLANPHFRAGGPVYHMLVIKGYLADGRWITNDPGTRLGADYLYSRDVLFQAIHDWNGGDVIHGKPVMIVVLPKE